MVKKNVNRKSRRQTSHRSIILDWEAWKAGLQAVVSPEASTIDPAVGTSELPKEQGEEASRLYL